ncbi:MAG: PqqD family protein [Prevotella sp.]|nr:PqqD family protein [Prevotella sp.]
MKAKKGFNLRTVCGEHIIVAEGVENIDFSRIISLNDSAAFLWEKAKGREFTADDLTDWLLQEYEVSEDEARRDVATLMVQWQEAGIAE